MGETAVNEMPAELSDMLARAESIDTAATSPAVCAEMVVRALDSVSRARIPLNDRVAAEAGVLDAAAGYVKQYIDSSSGIHPAQGFITAMRCVNPGYAGKVVSAYLGGLNCGE